MKRMLTVLAAVLILSACSPGGSALLSPDAGAYPPATRTFPAPSQVPTQRVLIIVPTVTPPPDRLIPPFELNRHWGSGAINDVFYSPDGQRLAVTTSLGVYLYGADALEWQGFFPSDSAWTAAAFTPDGSLLAMGSGSDVILVRLSDRSEVARFETSRGTIGRVFFSPDGAYLAALVTPPGEEVYNRFVELRQVADGKLLAAWDAGALPQVGFTTDGSEIYSWNPARMANVRHWSVPSGGEQAPLEGLQPAELTFSPDGRWMAYRSFSTTDMTLRDLASGEERAFAAEDGQSAGMLQFTTDGVYLLGCRYDGGVTVWETDSGQPVNTFDTGQGGSWMRISPDGTTLIVPGTEGVDRFRLPDGELLTRLEVGSGGILRAAISIRSDIVRLSRGFNPEDSAMTLFRPGDEVGVPLPAGSGALDAAWSPDGERLALAGWDGKVRSLRIATGEVALEVDLESEQVQSVAWSPDGKLLAASSMQKAVLWDAESGDPVLTIRTDCCWVDGLKFSPDDTALAGVVGNDRAMVWQVSDGALLAERSIESYSDGDVLAFLPDGETLAVAEFQSVRLWDWKEDEIMASLPVEDGEALSLAASEDGALLAVGRTDGTIELRDAATGEVLQSLQAGQLGITSLQFAEVDGALLAGSHDGVVRMWRVHR